MWTNRLTRQQADAVRDLAERCRLADGVAPLNEDAQFALDDASAQHLPLSPAGLPEVAGYLQWQPRHGTAQLMVDPAGRRRGIGSKLLAGLASRTAPELWAFGDLAPARGFAAAHALLPSRTLLMMTRSLAGVQPRAAREGVTLRGFTEADASQFLAVNAAAFADHPEQGGLDADGLARRVAEPWFDPEGLILAFDADGLAGFHWTKAEHGVGEVYVVGVHPRAQGRGYGGLLLDAGLSHLAGKGLRTVELYVDAADGIAVRMYEHAGFAEAHRDVLYAHTQE
jgi:mycothiol synthase